jgi:hypothetical protein
MENICEENLKEFPIISDSNIANKILDNILKKDFIVIGIDIEAAVEMSRFGILCLLQVKKFIIFTNKLIDRL